MNKTIIRCMDCGRKYSRSMIMTIENVLQPGRKTKAHEHYCIKCYNKEHYEDDNTRTAGNR
jgi:hypothetical protein